MVRYCPDGRHLAFEPLEDLASSLAARFPAVTVRPEALSDEAGTADFVVNLTTPAYSGLRSALPPSRPGAVRTVTVPLARLDDLLPQDYRPDFIKIDVEGNELGVLRGARTTLQKYKPAIAFEHGHGNGPINLEHCRAVFEEISAAGLRVFTLDGKHLSWEQFRTVYENGSEWNFLARK